MRFKCVFMLEACKNIGEGFRVKMDRKEGKLGKIEDLPNRREKCEFIIRSLRVFLVRGSLPSSYQVLQFAHKFFLEQ